MIYVFCGNSSPALMISLFTWVIRNLQPLEVTKPCRFKIPVISDKDFPCMSNECSMAMALILFGLLSALFLLVFTLSPIARSRLFVRFSDLPSLHPLAFLTCSDLSGSLADQSGFILCYAADYMKNQFVSLRKITEYNLHITLQQFAGESYIPA